MTEVKLSKPITVDGKQVNAIDLDFAKLTGADFIFCEREALAANANVPAIDPRLNANFQVRIAALASGIATELLLGLGLADFAVVVMEVRDFFLAQG